MLCKITEKLTNEIKNLCRQLVVKNRKIKRITAIKSQKKFFFNDFFDYATKYLNEDQLLFVKMQLNHFKKRKWSQNEKESRYLCIINLQKLIFF